MTLQELAAKMQETELSDTEQKEFVSLIEEEIGKLKRDNPQKYLELATGLVNNLKDLNAELKNTPADFNA